MVINGIAGTVVAVVIVLGAGVRALPYETWTAMAGSTIWSKFFLDFALSRHAHGFAAKRVARPEGSQPHPAWPACRCAAPCCTSAWSGCSLLALLLFNFPLLALWDRDATLLGVPLFPAALFMRSGPC
jgi:hypothetical protein